VQPSLQGHAAVTGRNRVAQTEPSHRSVIDALPALLNLLSYTKVEACEALQKSRGKNPMKSFGEQPSGRGGNVAGATPAFSYRLHQCD